MDYAWRFKLSKKWELVKIECLQGVYANNSELPPDITFIFIYILYNYISSPSPGVLYTPPPLHTFFVMYEHRGGHRRFEKVNLHIACEKYEAHGGTVFPHGLHTLTQ